MNQMKIYVSNLELNAGHTFDISCENSARVSKVVSYLTNIGYPLTFACFNQSGYDDLIDKTKQTFDSIQTRNCEYCSFTNDINTNTCKMCGNTSFNVIKYTSQDGDTTYVTKWTHLLLRDAVNLIQTALEAVIKSENLEHAFLLMRPPGHHSNMKQPRGFCFLNNVYIASSMCLSKLGVSKLCIIDWDVHHGNGTQELVMNNDCILFIDIHRHGGNFYPQTGSVHENNKHVINIPLESGSGESEYLKAFQNIIVPKMTAFGPQVILVSCGFDAHYRDPLGGMKLQTSSYAKFHSLLLEFHTPLVYFLEGGYDPDVIGECIHDITKINTTKQNTSCNLNSLNCRQSYLL